MHCRRARTALALLSVVLLGAGCGSRTDRTPGHAATSDLTLRRGLGADPGTLDPHLAADNAALAVVADLYEGLTTEARDGSIVAGAARSWTIGDGGLDYTFHLRRGLRWSNGDALTAADFAAGLSHAMAAETAAPNAGLLEAIDSLKVIDAETLRIRLRRPVPYLPALLALPVAAPRHARAATSESRPGNGPYRLLQRVPGERIGLERNPHYRGAAEVPIERVDYLTVADLATELNLYRAGELDLTSEVPNSQLDALRQKLPGELRIAPYLSVYAYAVNLARLPSKDARLALSMAVDRARITRQVTGAGETAAFGWVPDGIPQYAPARHAWRNLPRAEAVAKARALWESARQQKAAPARLTLCTDASANHHRTAVALADLWRTSLGIETQIVELEWNVYLDTRQHPGDCDLLRLGWSADFVDAEAFAAVFESDHPQNTLGYSSPAYDELLAQSRGATDTAGRLALLARAEAQLLDDAPVIPIFFRVSKRLVKPYVQGASVNPLGHIASRDLRFERD